MCRLELLVRLVPLPPITYNFYLRKLRFLRKVRKSMSLKMIINSHNSLFAHIFFSSHFIRCQRLKENAPHPTDFLRTLSQPSSKVRRNPFQHPLSLKIKAPVLITQSGIIDIIGTFNNVNNAKNATCHFYILRAVSAVLAVFKTAKTAITAHTCSTFISLSVFLSRGRNRFRGVAFRVGGKSQTLFRLSR